MNIWEQAAGYLVGAPVEVRSVDMSGAKIGSACLVGDQRVIELRSDLNNDDKLDTFLHECAHHKYHKIPQRPTPERRAELQSYWNIPEVRAGYEDDQKEIRADAFAEVHREWIDEATWPHAMDLEFKLKVWLESTTR